jgi:GPH family glycoside/pentoside/hexuronide:cation symporter
MSKAGMALGGGASGWILQFTGFNSQIGVQSDNVVLVMRVLMSGVPVVGLVIALILILRLPLDQKIMSDIRTKLESRRGTV